MPFAIDCMGLIIFAGGELVPAEAGNIPYARLPKQGFVIQQLSRFADRAYDDLRLADIVLLPQRGLSIHVGIVVALKPAPTVLHVAIREGCVDMFVEPKKLGGVFRYRGIE